MIYRVGRCLECPTTSPYIVAASGLCRDCERRAQDLRFVAALRESGSGGPVYWSPSPLPPLPHTRWTRLAAPLGRCLLRLIDQAEDWLGQLRYRIEPRVDEWSRRF